MSWLAPTGLGWSTRFTWFPHVTSFAMSLRSHYSEYTAVERTGDTARSGRGVTRTYDSTGSAGQLCSPNWGTTPRVWPNSPPTAENANPDGGLAAQPEISRILPPTGFLSSTYRAYAGVPYSAAH